MLTLKPTRNTPHYMNCGHWSYWLSRTRGEERCEACARKYPRQRDAREEVRGDKLLERL